MKAIAILPFDAAPLIAALALAAVHMIVPALRVFDVLPRSRWLSFSGGVSVGYVFMHILPKLGEGQTAFHEAGGSGGGMLAQMPHHVYVLALLGLAFFYVIERLALTRRTLRENEWQRSPGEPVHLEALRETPSRDIFWVHLASYGLYNVLIGFLLLHRVYDQPGEYSLLFFTVAMALHFFVTDHGLHAHHERTYHRIGRWVLAGSVMLGWGLGTLLTLPEVVQAGLFAFLVGSVILNVLKEELPAARQSRVVPFLAGAFGYAAIWLFFV